MKIRIYKALMSSLIYSISQLDETVGPKHGKGPRKHK